MADLATQIRTAKAAGYTDAQIAAHLSSDPTMGPKVTAARQHGYSDAEVVGHLAGGNGLADAKGAVGGTVTGGHSLSGDIGEAFQGGMQAARSGAGVYPNGELRKPQLNPVDWLKGDPTGGLGGVVAAAASPVTGTLRHFVTRPAAEAIASGVEGVGLHTYSPPEYDSNPLSPNPVRSFGRPLSHDEAVQQWEGSVGTALGTLGAGGAAGKVAALAKPNLLAERVAAFDRAGVPPTLAATGPAGSAPLARFAAENPLVGGAIKRRLQASVAATGERANALADQYGAAAARDTAGAAVQSGVTRFARGIDGTLPPDVARMLNSQRVTFGQKADALYGRVDRLIGDASRKIALQNTAAAIGRVMTNFDDANLAGTFKNAIVNQLGEDILSANGRVSWRDAARLRSVIRERLKSDPALRGTVSDAEVNSIYEGLTTDLRAGAERLGGTRAARAWDQASNYYRAGRARIDGSLSSVFGAASGERAYDAVVSAAMEGGRADVQRLLQVKRSLPADQWGDLAATSLRRMGTPTAGAAEVGAEAPQFSVSTFVTNYNKLSPRGRDILFGSFGGGGANASALRAQLDNLAHVASMQKAVERAANTSNTAVAGQAGATVAGLLTHPVPTVMTLAGIRGLGEAMTQPAFVRWLAGTARASPATMPARLAALRKLARGSAAVAAVAGPVEASLKGGLPPTTAPEAAAQGQSPGSGPTARRPIGTERMPALP